MPRQVALEGSCSKRAKDQLGFDSEVLYYRDLCICDTAPKKSEQIDLDMILVLSMEAKPQMPITTTTRLGYVPSMS